MKLAWLLKLKIIFKIFYDELYNTIKNGILHAFILKKNLNYKNTFNLNKNNNILMKFHKTIIWNRNWM